MRIEVRNMVCRHCVQALENALRELDIPYREVGIGYADTVSALSVPQLRSLDAALADLGFGRIDSAEQSLLERAKRAVMHHVRDPRTVYTDTAL